MNQSGERQIAHIEILLSSLMIMKEVVYSKQYGVWDGFVVAMNSW